MSQAVTNDCRRIKDVHDCYNGHYSISNEDSLQQKDFYGNGGDDVMIHCEKPITISKPQLIPKDNNSIGDDVLLYMLRGSTDLANSPPL
ncbi:hypothetical protein QTN25_000316 [Entamoeba marina]